MITRKSRSWHHTNNDKIIYFNDNDAKNSLLIDILAKIFNKISKGCPINIDFTIIPQLRDVILGQLKDEFPDDIFQIIAYKKKFVVYNIKPSSEVFFLNDNFQIDAIFKFKEGIRKVTALNAANTD